jgi:hypothetical protein
MARLLLIAKHPPTRHKPDEKRLLPSHYVDDPSRRSCRIGIGGNASSSHGIGVVRLQTATSVCVSVKPAKTCVSRTRGKDLVVIRE